MEQIIYDPQALRQSLEAMIQSSLTVIVPIDFLLGLLVFGYKIVYNGIRQMMGV